MNWSMQELPFKSLPFICELEKSCCQQKWVSVMSVLLATYLALYARCALSVWPWQFYCAGADVTDVSVDVAWISSDVADVLPDVVGRSIKLVISPRLLWEAATRDCKMWKENKNGFKNRIFFRCLKSSVLEQNKQTKLHKEWWTFQISAILCVGGVLNVVQADRH